LSKINFTKLKNEEWLITDLSLNNSQAFVINLGDCQLINSQ